MIKQIKLRKDEKEKLNEKRKYYLVDANKLYFINKDDNEEESAKLEKEKKVLKTMVDIKKKYGKNAIVRGMNLKEGATAMDRNRQIGGHHE